MKVRPLSIIIAIFVAGCLVGVGIWINYLNTTYVAKINFTNAKNVKIIQVIENKEPKELFPVNNSADSFRLPIDKPAIVTYDGASGYESGFIAINSTKPEVTINPDYSTAHKQQIMQAELLPISKQIDSVYPNVARTYNIMPGDLFSHGSWFVLLLQSKTNSNTDNLRILFKKDGSNYKKVSGAYIILTQYNTKNIPLDILTSANSIKNNNDYEKQSYTVSGPGE